MNWGYDSSGDGYFAFHNFNPVINGKQNNFNSNKGMVYNIIP